MWEGKGSVGQTGEDLETRHDKDKEKDGPSIRGNGVKRGSMSGESAGAKSSRLPGGTGDRRDGNRGVTGTEKENDRPDGMDQTDKGKDQQRYLFATSTGEESMETQGLFKRMEEVIGQLRTVFTEGMTAGWGREELEDRIRVILGENLELMGTYCQKTVNGFILRSCLTLFSLRLDEREVYGFWDQL